MVEKRASFADFFALAPGLLALDRELDAEGCPVAYRKYLAADWLMGGNWCNELIGQANALIANKSLNPEAVCSDWYNNVYGHAVYQPPASRFVALSTPVPVVVTWSPVDAEVTLPDVTLIQYELEESLKDILRSDGVLLHGLCRFQELPAARWVWLAMADYDASVSSFELPRLAYHLSLWHSLQTLEKLLKAALITAGEPPRAVRKYNHNVKRLISELAQRDVRLTDNGSQLAHKIETLVGGPSIRYEDDLNNQRNRLEMAERSLEVHHLLLEFFASDAEHIGAILSRNGADFLVGLSYPGFSGHQTEGTMVP